MEESAGVTIVNMAHFNNVFESFKTIKLCRVSGVSSWLTLLDTNSVMKLNLMIQISFKEN